MFNGGMPVDLPSYFLIPDRKGSRKAQLQLRIIAYLKDFLGEEKGVSSCMCMYKVHSLYC